MTDSQRLSASEYVAMMRQRRQAQATNPPTAAQPPAAPANYDAQQPTMSPTPADYAEEANLTPQEREERRRRSAFEESEMFPGQFVPVPEEDILVWTAPVRPYKQRDRQYYTTIAIIVFLLSLILFFAGQFLPIAVVISVGFLAYVLSAVPPIIVTNKITTWGIRIEKDIYYWELLGRFWYTDKYKQRILHLETAKFPGRIMLLLGDKTEAEITDILSQVLLKQKPEPTAIDKATDWLQKTFPIDLKEI